MGRVFFYRVEQKGRIAGYWNYATHVVIDERTAAVADPFAGFRPSSTPEQDRQPGRPLLRKVREFVEVIQPARTYPDFGAAPVTRGCVLGIEFRSKAIPVSSTNSVRLPTSTRCGDSSPAWLLVQVLPPKDELTEQFDLGKLVPDFQARRPDRRRVEPPPPPARRRDRVDRADTFADAAPGDDGDLTRRAAGVGAILRQANPNPANAALPFVGQPWRVLSAADVLAVAVDNSNPQHPTTTTSPVVSRAAVPVRRRSRGPRSPPGSTGGASPPGSTS